MCAGLLAVPALAGYETGAHPQTDWKTKCPRKILARAFKWVCSFILSARRGRLRRRGGGGWDSGYVANFTMAGFAVSGYMLRAHQTRTMKKCGPPHAEKRVLCRTFRLSPEIFVPQQEAGPASCSGLRLRPRNGMRKLRQSGAYAPPRRFPAAPATAFTGFKFRKCPANNPPPLQRSYNTLAKPAICSSKALFPPNKRVGRPYRTFGAIHSVAGKIARAGKIRLSAQNERRVSTAGIRAFCAFGKS